MNTTREFLETIKVEHTIFALPFAYLTLFLVSGGWPAATTFGWITLAMVAGRTFGMAANRLIDARIDARNPRTAGRALPAGRLKPAAVILYMAVAIALFLAAVWQLAPVCRRLWPIVIAAMVIYPYAKRFTWAAHLFLGAVYLMIPTAIWLAVSGELSRAAVMLGAGAGLWVAGFDIIYACQDVEVDRREKLHSIPVRFGVTLALGVARVFHIVFVAGMIYAGFLLTAGTLYFVGVGVMALVLVYEHRLVSPRDLSRINAAFFTANGVASIMLFGFVALDCVREPVVAVPVVKTTLVGTYWKLVDVNGEPAPLPIDQPEMYLTLRADPQIATGFAGCNSFNGSYEVRGDSLRFEPLIATLSACAHDDTEQEFLHALEQTRRHEILGDTLVLSGENGAVVRLRAVDF